MQAARMPRRRRHATGIRRARNAPAATPIPGPGDSRRRAPIRRPDSTGGSRDGRARASAARRTSAARRPHDADDALPAPQAKRRVRQADREDLVRAQRGIGAVRAIEHVEEPAARRIDEAREARLRRAGERAESRAAGLPSRSANSAISVSALNHSALISTGLPMRGVTTQSPTLASIQVSCTPGSPARSSPSAGSTCDAVARAPDVPVDDRRAAPGRLRATPAGRPSPRRRRATLRDTRAPHRRCCIRVSRPLPGNTFGSMPRSTKRAKVRRMLRRGVEAAGRERESGQRDHRVAAPVAEPRIARDHRFAVRYARQRAGEHEAVGGEHQLIDPRRRVAHLGDSWTWRATVAAASCASERSHGIVEIDGHVRGRGSATTPTHSTGRQRQRRLHRRGNGCRGRTARARAPRRDRSCRTSRCTARSCRRGP